MFKAKNRQRAFCSETCKVTAYKARKRAGERRIGQRTATCDGCGKQFATSRPEARWCSKQCANRHWGNVRARQRGQLSTARYTDREIFERDGWRCHLCRKPVKQDAPRTDPDGATIDHIVPISLGGSDEPSNVATAHYRCNLDKRARAVNDQLRLV
jgi:5-methylcytosine-specific restriction endonuclease McrA